MPRRVLIEVGMQYSTFSGARLWVAAITLLLAIGTIAYFGSSRRKMSGWTALIIVLWGLVPPSWFFLEYYAVDHDWFTVLPMPKDALLESVKTYADYASKIWAAVLAAVLVLVKKD
jgi:hypothetical protein